MYIYTGLILFLFLCHKVELVHVCIINIIIIISTTTGQRPRLLWIIVGLQCYWGCGGSVLQAEGQVRITERAAAGGLQLELRQCWLQWRAHGILIQVHTEQWRHLWTELLSILGICECILSIVRINYNIYIYSYVKEWVYYII